jgi:hypothetical protein
VHADHRLLRSQTRSMRGADFFPSRVRSLSGVSGFRPDRLLRSRTRLYAAPKEEAPKEECKFPSMRRSPFAGMFRKNKGGENWLFSSGCPGESSILDNRQ